MGGYWYLWRAERKENPQANPHRQDSELFRYWVGSACKGDAPPDGLFFVCNTPLKGIEVRGIIPYTPHQGIEVRGK